MISPTRRGLITGLASLLVAPAIIRVANLMQVRTVERSAQHFVVNNNLLHEFGRYDAANPNEWMRSMWAPKAVRSLSDLPRLIAGDVLRVHNSVFIGGSLDAPPEAHFVMSNCTAVDVALKATGSRHMVSYNVFTKSRLTFDGLDMPCA